MKKLLLLLGLIAAIMLAYYCVKSDSKKIQDDITARLGGQMNVANISDAVDMRVYGRDVVLTGVVDSESSKIEAEKVAGDLYGVRTVDNQIKIQGSVVNVIDEPIFEPDPLPEIAMSDLEMPEIEIPEAEIFVELETETETNTMPDLALSEPQVSELEAPEVAPDIPVEAESVTAVQAEPVVEPEVVTMACQADLAALLEKEKINFDSGKTSISSGSYGLLNRLATAAKDCKDSIIAIHGYTDSSGDLNMNTQLSLNRAKSVGRYLISKGVKQEIRVVGNGPNDPIADNATAEGRAKNRRIEFKVFKPKN